MQTSFKWDMEIFDFFSEYLSKTCLRFFKVVSKKAIFKNKNTVKEGLIHFSNVIYWEKYELKWN